MIRARGAGDRDEELVELRTWRGWADRDYAIGRVATAFDSVLARLDVAEARAEKADYWQMSYEEEHEVMGEKLAAALASPEGVVTLDGERFTVVRRRSCCPEPTPCEGCGKTTGPHANLIPCQPGVSP